MCYIVHNMLTSCAQHAARALAALAGLHKASSSKQHQLEQDTAQWSELVLYVGLGVGNQLESYPTLLHMLYVCVAYAGNNVG